MFFSLTEEDEEDEPLQPVCGKVLYLILLENLDTLGICGFYTGWTVELTEINRCYFRLCYI